MRYTRHQIDAVRELQQLLNVPGQLTDEDCIKYLSWHIENCVVGKIDLAYQLHLFDRQTLVLRSLVKG